MAETTLSNSTADQDIVQDRKTYTVDEVSEMAGLSRASTYSLVRAGTIPAIRAGRRWLIPRRRFQDWLDGKDS